MLAVEIHQLLTKIANLTYPDKEIKKFFIEIIPKESKTKHGDYSPMYRKIRIFNLSRKTSYIIKTTIHELAHHCEYSIYGDTGHSKRFYQVYKDLLETTIKMGLLTWEDIKKVNDSADIRNLIRHFGEIDIQYNEKLDDKKGMKRITVFNAYLIKDKLKERKYKYNHYEQSWFKEIPENILEEELSFLSKLINKDNIKVVDANKIELEAIYYIIVENGYEVKEELKANNYKFKGYNFNDSVWVKKIKASNLNEEIAFLYSLDVKYRVKGNK